MKLKKKIFENSNISLLYLVVKIKIETVKIVRCEILRKSSLDELIGLD